MAAPPPRHYVTEPGGLAEIAIPAVLRPLPPMPATPPSSRAAPHAMGTEARVCADIAARQAMGLRKYGISVESNPLASRHWLQHAYEEALDLSIYLRRLIEQIDRDAAATTNTGND